MNDSDIMEEDLPAIEPPPQMNVEQIAALEAALVQANEIRELNQKYYRSMCLQTTTRWF